MIEKQNKPCIQSIQVSDQLLWDNHTWHISIQSFVVHAYDTHNHELWNFSMQVAYPKNQDVIDIACYYEKDGDVYLATNTSIRPILSARQSWIEKEVDDKKYDWLFQEWVWVIYSIEQGDISIIDAVQRALQQKLWLSVDPKNVVVWNPYFPSIGASWETCIPCFAKVEIPSDTSDYFLYWEKFEAERKVSFMTLQNIIDKFFAKELEDMRLVFLAYSLAQYLQYPLKNLLSVDLHNATIYKEQKIDDNITLIENKDQLEIFHQSNTDTVASITLIPEEENNRLFLQKYNLSVENIYKDWKKESYIAESVIRSWVDSIDIWWYFWSCGKLYVLCKETLRPTVQARNFQPHYIHAPGDIWHIEWIYGSLSNSLPKNTNDILDIAKDIMSSKVTVELLEQEYMWSYFPSIGNNAEKVHLVMQNINPAIIKNIAEERDIYKPRFCAIEVDTIIDAYNSWLLRDPRLVLIAYIIKNKFAYKNIADAPITQEDRKAFQQAIHQPLQVDLFMKTVAQEKWELIYDLHVTGKKYSIWYRRLVSYIEQELWWFLGERKRLMNDTDKHFFAAMLPMFAVPSEELASKYINYITHDQWHYLQWDIVPYFPDTNMRMDMETYTKYMSWSEANAVFDSDYLYPLQMWLERFENLIGGESVATTFHKLGMYDDDEVRAAIISIERDWVIPDAILLHPMYNDVRHNIVDRLLRFYFMDHLQMVAHYEKWKKMPHVAKVALQFCNTTNDVTLFDARMSSYHSLIHWYDEWVNTLKAYVSRIMVKHISLPALHIGMTMQYIDDTKSVWYEKGIEYCDNLLQRLAYRKIETEKTRDTITSMIANDATVKAIRYANYIRTQITEIYSLYEKFIEQTDLLSVDQKTHVQSSRIPYFTWYTDMPENLHDMVLAKEKENLERVGR